jgi:hypothetical protein
MQRAGDFLVPAQEYYPRTKAAIRATTKEDR